jgi:predicted metal-binding membrane protein
MNAAPGTNLGPIGWFTVTWSVMMAAMMLPSLAPVAAASAAAAFGRTASRAILFAGGYIFVWTAAGIAAYGAVELGRDAFSAELSWPSGGKWLSASVLLSAAAYELTQQKRAWLARCRRPAADEDRPAGSFGAIPAGVAAGVCCLGCSWALMAALFALGVMSLTWMVLIAALVALEKLAPWPRTGTNVVAAVLAAIAIAVAAIPSDLPGLVVPSRGAIVMMTTTK